MYLLYRSRHLFSWLPALLVAGSLLIASQQAALKIQPHYDEATMELALVEPPSIPPPEVPEPPPPEPEPVLEPEPVVDAVVVAPEPVIAAKPKPKPKPQPEKTRPVEKPRPVTPAPRAVTATSKPAVAAPARPAAPPVNAQAVENGYLQAMRRELEQRKRYPTGRQASLERPEGEVEIWLEVDRSGRVLDSGIANKARSMLLNRAASSSLQSISQVKPFPEQAFAGQAKKRFTATFNYQAP